MGKGLAFLLLAGGAGAPVNHFGFINYETVMRMGREAGGRPDRTADVFSLTAGAADEVVMIIADTVFVERGGLGRLDATNDALISKHVQDVIDGLAGDRTEFSADLLGEYVGRRVRVAGHGPENGNALGRDREVMLAQGVFRVSHLRGAKSRFGLCQKLLSLYFFGVAALVAGGAVHSTGSLAALRRSRTGA